MISIPSALKGRINPNHELIGVAGSRRSLHTPALVLDLDILESNIRKMTAFVHGNNEKLRPHAKTHKSSKIAGMQINAGAVGICCAKLGEAETLAALGIDGILITSPVVTPQKIERLLDLNDRLEELLVVVDSISVAERLVAHLARRKRPIQVLVDMGTGRIRTGAATPEDAAKLAGSLKGQDKVRLRGLQVYAGQIQHIQGYAERVAAAQNERTRIKAAMSAFRAIGAPLDIVAGSGTGTFELDSGQGVFSELQVGSYIFMDTEYNRVDNVTLSCAAFQTSLFVQSCVLNTNVPGQATVDAGFKAFSTDGPKPVLIEGAPRNSGFAFMGDEHGCVLLPDGAAPLKVGDSVVFETPHCDPTVNLYDYYCCVRGNDLVDIWPVDTRGQTW
jgi:3-hydroxy-D-aspartate aldolase